MRVGWHSPFKLLRFEKLEFSESLQYANISFYMFLFILIFTRALERVVCLGESRLSQVNNSPGANVFPAGVANFGKAM